MTRATRRPMPVFRALRISALAWPVLLAACASNKPMSHPTSPPALLAPSVCTQGICVINVMVNGKCSSADNIMVDKPLVSTSNAVEMRWIISPDSFAFAPNGIQLDPPDPQFEVKPSPRPNEFRIHNHHRSNGDFYYFINIQGCAQADPFIRNN